MNLARSGDTFSKTQSVNLPKLITTIILTIGMSNEKSSKKQNAQYTSKVVDKG